MNCWAKCVGISSRSVLLREFEEKLEQVVVGDEQHEGKEHREADHLGAFPEDSTERAAFEFFEEQQQDMATIQSRNGQQVEDAKLEADNRGEEEEVRPAAFSGFPNHFANPERPADIIH